MILWKLLNPLPWPSERVKALIRERVGPFYYQRVYKRMIRLAPRSQDPYSTHLPILCALAAIVQPTRIVEYGSGLISTTTFLNRTIFPKVISLLSFENNREWYDNVASQIGHDTRLQFRLVDSSMKDAVSKNELTGAELVFVDDEDSSGRRADTIAAISLLRLSGIPIVIHDIELPRLRRRAGGFDHVFRFDGLHPQTGVAWNGSWDLAHRLPAINRLIRMYSTTVPQRCVEQWSAVFYEALRLVRPPS